MSDKLKKQLPWVLSTLGIVALFFALAIFGSDSDSGSKLGSPKLSLPISEEDNFAGNRNAKHVYIEYSDFACPACSQYYLISKEIEREFGDKLAIVFRHFPLNMHPNAKLAAQAAEAAAIQDSFWDMHDMLFNTQEIWDSKTKQEAQDYFESLADSLGLSVEQFTADINSEQVINKVERDNTSALDSKLNGTPSIFIDGEYTDIPATYGELRNILIKIIGE